MPINNTSQSSPEKNPLSKMEDLGLPKPLEEIATSPAIEQAPTPEARPETQAEQAPKPEQKAEVRPMPEAKIESTVPTTSVVPQTVDELTKQIEEILSENLAEDYKKMPPALQQKFRQEGEVTARKIKEMLDSGKVKFKKIVDLLMNWLKLIPGVNQYFLHQEAKIKADKIVHLKEGSINGL